MTEPKKTPESESATARLKEKPYMPIEHRPLLGVDEVEALTVIPTKIIRANVCNGLLKACMAGSTTMRIRRRVWTPGLTRCPRGAPKGNPTRARLWTKWGFPMT